MLRRSFGCSLLFLLFAVAELKSSNITKDATNDYQKFNVRLADGTSFDITTNGFEKFSNCLQEGVTQGNNSVHIIKFNECAVDLYRRVQSNITSHFRIRDIGDLGAALRNISSLHRLNGNIVKNLETVQKSFQRLRIPNVENTLFHRSLTTADHVFRDMSKTVTSGQRVQTSFQNFNKTLQTIGSLATAGAKSVTPTVNQLKLQFQEDLKNIDDITRSLPKADVVKLTQNTVGNFTVLVRNLTGSLPEVMRRAGTQGTQGTRPLREFISTMTQSLKNASFSISGNSSAIPAAGQDLMQAYDGFQLAVNNGVVAMSDLVRGSLRLVNPANWNVQVGDGGKMEPVRINRFIGSLFKRRG
ncbi:unnamed protein product [Ixodes persulcatus]